MPRPRTPPLGVVLTRTTELDGTLHVSPGGPGQITIMTGADVALTIGMAAETTDLQALKYAAYSSYCA